MIPFQLSPAHCHRLSFTSCQDIWFEDRQLDIIEKSYNIPFQLSPGSKRLKIIWRVGLIAVEQLYVWISLKDEKVTCCNPEEGEKGHAETPVLGIEMIGVKCSSPKVGVFTKSLTRIVLVAFWGEISCQTPWSKFAALARHHVVESKAWRQSWPALVC